MRCTVLLFAQLRESLGCDSISIDLPDGTTVGVALDELSRRHASIASQRSRLAVAVNQRYVTSTHILRNGEEIALIPPVSGG